MLLRTTICSSVLLINTLAVAQTAAPDSQISQIMLMEIRQLRQDLQATAATVQRVQIVVYRLHAEAALMERATQRLDQARSRGIRIQSHRKMTTANLEQAEARARNSQNTPDQRYAEDNVMRLKSDGEALAIEEQQCQVEQSEAEAQFRAEQAKMSDLQDQLDKLDRVLAAYGGN